MKKIVISTLLVVGLIAVTAMATFAYFSNTEQRNATVTTAKIDLDTIGSFPLMYENMLPAEDWKYQEFRVKNVGTAKADFYVEMDAGVEAEGEPNFCKPVADEDYMLARVEVWDGSAYVGVWQGSICKLYPWTDESIVLQLANDVDVNATKYFRVGLKLLPETPNSFQNKTKSDMIRFIATQYNGPALVSCADASTYPNGQWPECDPNY